MFRALTRLLRRGAVDPRQLDLPLAGALRSVRSVPPALPILVPSPQTAPRPRRRRTAAEQDAAAAVKFTARHAELNAERFGGELQPITIEVSPRLRSRLGYYRVATVQHPGLIVISRRHLRRHGWDEACDTLLHEMVHQWQDETGKPVDHGRHFRAKARAVGALPRARRPIGAPSADRKG
jgi:hypothetical protein